MRVDDFDFELPEDRIALRPERPRDASRLLVVDPGGEPALADHVFGDLPGLLRPGDVIVFNDTRVMPAALKGVRHRPDSAAAIFVNLMNRLDGNRWSALARPAKRLKPGDRIRFGSTGETCLDGVLDATVEARGEAGQVTLAFDFYGPRLDEAIEALGAMPLPPYIAARREADAQDRDDYQTLYAARKGAVAAPTAGLHFTDRIFEALDACGVGRQFVTLHVGPGTFLPVRAEKTEDHVMHAEWGAITAEVAGTLNAARAAGGRIVAAGTTALRLLESACDGEGRFAPFRGETGIFITPGYRFRAIDALVTNFHLPRSTLFMLVSAFSGLETMQRAYAHAVQSGYRFYSYGDACLLHRAESDP